MKSNFSCSLKSQISSRSSSRKERLGGTLKVSMVENKVTYGKRNGRCIQRQMDRAQINNKKPASIWVSKLSMMENLKLYLCFRVLVRWMVSLALHIWKVASQSEIKEKKTGNLPKYIAQIPIPQPPSSTRWIFLSPKGLENNLPPNVRENKWCCR